MEKERLQYPHLFRFFEILIGLLAWSSIFLVIFFSVFHPMWVMVFSILFSSYWVGRVLLQAIGSTISYREIVRVEKIDWLTRSKAFPHSERMLQERMRGIEKKISASHPIIRGIFSQFSKRGKIRFISRFGKIFRIVKKEEVSEIRNLTEDIEKLKKLDGDNVSFDELYHVVMLADYKEGEDIIRPSIEKVVDANYPNERIILVLANEERSREETEEYAKRLQEEFKDTFFAFLNPVHPDLPNEVKAKGANFRYAGKEVQKFLDEKHIPYKNVIVSAFDGDTRASYQYFSRLTYMYISEKDRDYRSFQPTPFYFNNIWETTWFARAVAFGTSFWSMMEAGLSGELPFTYAGHATSFSGVVRNDFWANDCINEDSKQGFKAFLNERGKHRVLPMYVPIFMDAVLSGTTKETLINQYKQLQRWAYGMEHLPYLFVRFIKEKELQTGRVALRLWKYFYENYMWGCSVFLVFFSTNLPLLFHPDLAYTLFGVNYRTLFLWVWNFGSLGVIIFFIISVGISKKFGIRTNISRGRFLLATFSHWIFFPVTTVVFGGITGIDASTRLLTKRYLTYWTTKKVATENIHSS